MIKKLLCQNPTILLYHLNKFYSGYIESRDNKKCLNYNFCSLF